MKTKIHYYEGRKINCMQLYLGGLGNKHAVFIVLVVAHKVDEHNVLVADFIHIDTIAS